MNISDLWEVALMIILVVTSYIWVPFLLLIIFGVSVLAIIGIIYGGAYLIDLFYIIKGKYYTFMYKNKLIKRKF